MKRSLGDGEIVDATDDGTAGCLVQVQLPKVSESKTPIRRFFDCKTCNRQFSSFQALGGHRASHKRPRLLSGELFNDGGLLERSSEAPKEKMHECSICGLEFEIGQALGGHMRRHRVAAVEAVHDDDERRRRSPVVPVFKKSNSSKRVFCLDLELRLGKSRSPMFN